MVFVAGAVVGCVVGLAGGALLQRRAGASNLIQGRGFATAIAMLALVVAAVALANSNSHHDQTTAATAPAAAGASAATTTTTSEATTLTTSAATEPSGLVKVPDVEHLTRANAVAILQRAGLKVSIETLALANVPTGYVLSQNPLPAAMTTAGATVTLVVSAAA